EGSAASSSSSSKGTKSPPSTTATGRGSAKVAAQGGTGIVEVPFGGFRYFETRG
ncbi:unnamed protein product, partial [Amoebophrya sp. A25]